MADLLDGKPVDEALARDQEAAVEGPAAALGRLAQALGGTDRKKKEPPALEGTEREQAVARVAVVQALLEAGAPTSSAANDGDTALMAAAGRGGLASVRLLLEAGADPDGGSGPLGPRLRLRPAQAGHPRARRGPRRPAAVGRRLVYSPRPRGLG